MTQPNVLAVRVLYGLSFVVPGYINPRLMGPSRGMEIGHQIASILHACEGHTADEILVTPDVMAALVIAGFGGLGSEWLVDLEGAITRVPMKLQYAGVPIRPMRLAHHEDLYEGEANG